MPEAMSHESSVCGVGIKNRRAPAVTVAAVQGGGRGGHPGTVSPPGKFLHNSLVSPSARRRFAKWRMKRDDQTGSLVAPGLGRGLPHVQQVTPQVITVELDQVECLHEHVRVMTAVSNTIEGCDPVVAAHHGLPVDDTGPRAQLGHCLDDERESDRSDRYRGGCRASRACPSFP